MNYTNTCPICGIGTTMSFNAKVTTPTCRKAQTGTIHPDGSVTCEPIPENCPHVVRPVEVTPAIIQTSIKMPNGTNFRVYTSGGVISSFICDENWNVPKEPYATCPIDWASKSAVEYHKFVRAEHGDDCVVKELSIANKGRFKKGVEVWNKGVKMRESTREKLKNRPKHYHTEETKRKIALSSMGGGAHLRGRKQSEHVVKKRAETLKRLYSEGKMVSYFKGRKRTEGEEMERRISLLKKIDIDIATDIIEAYKKTPFSMEAIAEWFKVPVYSVRDLVRSWIPENERRKNSLHLKRVNCKNGATNSNRSNTDIQLKFNFS